MGASNRRCTHGFVAVGAWREVAPWRAATIAKRSAPGGAARLAFLLRFLPFCHGVPTGSWLTIMIALGNRWRLQLTERGVIRK